MRRDLHPKTLSDYIGIGLFFSLAIGSIAATLIYGSAWLSG